MRKPFAAAALLLSLACQILACQALAWQVRVKSVHDGDSLSVVNADEAKINIRLYGVDCPEAKQTFGYQAKKALSGLAARKTVDISPMDGDRYGRTVALVHTPDGTLANLAMVRAGYAWVYEQYCTQPDICAQLRSAQAEARAAGRGLWADSDPVPPWEWRKLHKTEEWYAKPVRALKTIASKIRVVIR